MKVSGSYMAVVSYSARHLRHLRSPKEASPSAKRSPKLPQQVPLVVKQRPVQQAPLVLELRPMLQATLLMMEEES